ncbi:hypothetical protein TraAM80_10085 [Trypanosoma rangeli]|uniref:Uncharacterized protein n=1 Tax=Trypanosoma rangeli TaxID=5698 RepID=A0A422MRF7_TRYRA|nr:uncharacterized protein TraAM80_10085 [Trypanosoma rangeli]RNE95806.1 hypothetical protein TraAM80_10085 [Trypanosoma rangeli]|eukprot:RNE95806.1 hypothetical protein TraAM80_10085 [Trypanosoma rangeli]
MSVTAALVAPPLRRRRGNCWCVCRPLPPSCRGPPLPFGHVIVVINLVGGAWGGWKCTESDWRDLMAVAREMAEAEIEGQYCSCKPEFVQGLRVGPQAEAEGEIVSSGPQCVGHNSICCGR